MLSSSEKNILPNLETELALEIDVDFVELMSMHPA